MTLRDIRLVDLSHGIAGAYLSRLFIDGGADVIRVEPSDGVALRRRSAADVAEGGHGPLRKLVDRDFFLAAPTDQCGHIAH